MMREPLTPALSPDGERQMSALACFLASLFLHGTKRFNCTRTAVIRRVRRNFAGVFVGTGSRHFLFSSRDAFGGDGIRGREFCEPGLVSRDHARI